MRDERRTSIPSVASRSRTVSRRFPKRSPRFAPSARYAFVPTSPPDGRAGRDALDRVRTRGRGLVHDRGHLANAVEPEDGVRHGGGEGLEQVEGLALDRRSRGPDHRSIVRGPREGVAARLHLDVEVHHEVLRLVLLAGIRAVPPRTRDPRQEQPRGHHRPSSGGRRPSVTVTGPSSWACEMPRYCERNHWNSSGATVSGASSRRKWPQPGKSATAALGTTSPTPSV